MAAVTATRVDNEILKGNYDGSGANAIKRLRGILYVTNGATQVAGGTDTLDVDVQTLLRAALGRSDTFTLRDWMVFQNAQSSSVSYAATGTVASNTISLTPKTPADWSTNATISASALVVPYGISFVVDVT